MLCAFPVHRVHCPPPPVCVSAALTLAEDLSTIPRPTISDQFSLSGRVALVSGRNPGLGLEMPLALCEARARAVYCIDLPTTPSPKWKCTWAYVQRMGGGARLEYISADVRRPGFGTTCHRLEIARDVWTSASLLQVCLGCEQMVRFGIPGSIILVSSISGAITNKVRNPSVEATTLLWQLTGIQLATRQDHAWVLYNASKSAVLQMTRSMACELGNRGIRVNSLQVPIPLQPCTLIARNKLSRTGNSGNASLRNSENLRSIWWTDTAQKCCVRNSLPFFLCIDSDIPLPISVQPDPRTGQREFLPQLLWNAH
jgi:NAD(P)-dependent dehydrogenase (short-subunit alcohol dehydrogenase family)